MTAFQRSQLLVAINRIKDTAKDLNAIAELLLIDIQSQECEAEIKIIAD